MVEVIELLEEYLGYIVSIASIVIELVGIGVLISSAFKSLMKVIQHKNVSMDLAHGITLALEFLMCGEVLKTVIAHNLSELYILGAIVILRTAMTVLLHWEMKNEKEELELEEEEKEHGKQPD